MDNIPVEIVQRLVLIFDRQLALKFLIRFDGGHELWIKAKTLPLLVQRLGEYALKEAFMFHNDAKALPEKLNSILALHLGHLREGALVVAAEFAKDAQEVDVARQFTFPLFIFLREQASSILLRDVILTIITR